MTHPFPTRRSTDLLRRAVEGRPRRQPVRRELSPANQPREPEPCWAGRPELQHDAGIRPHRSDAGRRYRAAARAAGESARPSARLGHVPARPLRSRVPGDHDGSRRETRPALRPDPTATDLPGPCPIDRPTETLATIGSDPTLQAEPQGAVAGRRVSTLEA